MTFWLALFAFFVLGLIIGHIIGYMRGEDSNEYYVASLKKRLEDQTEKTLDAEADVQRARHDLNLWMEERYEAPSADREEA